MIIKPFRAIRYDKDLKNVISPPYDIINFSLKEELKQKSEYNVVRLILPEGEDKYKVAGSLFDDWIDRAILIKDDRPALYPYKSIYKINGSSKILQGLLAIFKLSPFKKDVIMPHEKTFSAPKKDRFDLMKSCRTDFSPVLGLYDSLNGPKLDFDSIINSADNLLDFETDGLTHQLYRQQDKQKIDKILKVLKNYPIIIGDGHHRYETALNYRNFTADSGIKTDGHNWVLIFLVDMAGDNISLLSIKRILKGISLDKMKIKLSKFFDFHNPDIFNGDNKSFLASGGGKAYTMTKKATVEKFLDGIDLSHTQKQIPTVVVDKLIIDYALKDENIKTIYYEDDKENEIYKDEVVITTHPIDYHTIVEVVNENGTMPQKSTFFYPKIPTGLVINRLDCDV